MIKWNWYLASRRTEKTVSRDREGGCVKVEERMKSIFPAKTRGPPAKWQGAE